MPLPQTDLDKVVVTLSGQIRDLALLCRKTEAALQRLKAELDHVKTHLNIPEMDEDEEIEVYK